MKKQSELEKRIKALELEIAALKARPAIQYHYHYAQPYYPPAPTYIPTWPMPQPYIPPFYPVIYGATAITRGYAQTNISSPVSGSISTTLTSSGDATNAMVVSCH